jgi:muconate cycloisomerase
MKVVRIEVNEVVVPARPDSINSPEVDHALHKLPFGGQKGWTIQFDRVFKPIIRLHTADGVVGLGEAYRGLAEHQLRPIAEHLLGRDLLDLNWQDLPIPSGRVYDGFECAVLDAIGKHHRLPLVQLLGGEYRERVKVGYWTGHRTTADAVRKAMEGKELGFDCIKFKCALTDPVVAWCQAIRDACGPGFRIILDPNERFETAADTMRIAKGLTRIGNVLCLEDPIPRWNLEELAHLRQRIDIPLALHISLPYAEMGQQITDAIRAIRLGCCDYFNFNGGIYNFNRLATLADAAGLPYWHGSEVDLGILEASYVHKSAASSLATLPADIFGRLVREHDLLAVPLLIERGEVCVPHGPGLGVELDADAVINYTVNRWECKL